MQKENNYLSISIVCGITILVVSSIIILGFLKIKEMDAKTELLKLKGVLSDYELEGSCNTGFIGVDFQANFVNEKYKEKTEYTYNFTKYNSEWYPKLFNLKNIDGLNCNFKVKGKFPILLLMDKLDELEKIQSSAVSTTYRYNLVSLD